MYLKHLEKNKLKKTNIQLLANINFKQLIFMKSLHYMLLKPFFNYS